MGDVVVKAADLDRILKHVYAEPKFRAQMEYWRAYPSPIQQMLGQIPRAAAEQFIDGDGWPDGVADRAVTVIDYGPPPDFDWWEPRHDHPWRRQAARDRGESP